MSQLPLFIEGQVALDVQLLLKCGLVRPVRRTENGRVTEYELTHAGRILLGGKKEE